MKCLCCFFFPLLLFNSPKELEGTERGTSGRADTEAPLKRIQSELKGGSKMFFSITVIKIFSLVSHLN